MQSFSEIITDFIGSCDDSSLRFVVIAIFGLFLLKVFCDILRGIFKFRV